MAALPSLRQLKYLLALEKYLNFTRAAEASFVSQSTLSAGLKELEELLGVQLVERDRQSVAITPTGQAVLDRARGLLAAAEDMVEYATSVSKPMSGLLRLGVIPTIAPFILPSILPQIREKYKDLKLALREDLTQNLLDRIRNRQLDMALIALPYATDGLITRELFSDEFWLTAREEDDAFKGKTVTVPAKMADRLLLLEEGHCLREHSLQACGKSEIANAEGIEATSLLTLVQMVESGMGIALLPEMAIKGGILINTNLLARPLAAPAPKRMIALVARESSAHIAELDILAETIKNIKHQNKKSAISIKNRKKMFKQGK
jgi:LysR family hydrogen peroxide-inducible transcriptional activator